MLMVGMMWLISMIVLAFLAFLGGVFQKSMNDFLMQWTINPMFQESLGTSWWIPALYYIMLVIIAIAITYRCYQEVIATTMYYPEMGMG
jgi:hypothetical protein